MRALFCSQKHHLPGTAVAHLEAGPRVVAARSLRSLRETYVDVNCLRKPNPAMRTPIHSFGTFHLRPRSSKSSHFGSVCPLDRLSSSEIICGVSGRIIPPCGAKAPPSTHPALLSWIVKVFRGPSHSMSPDVRGDNRTLCNSCPWRFYKSLTLPSTTASNPCTTCLLVSSI